jgi:hypothetical protein
MSFLIVAPDRTLPQRASLVERRESTRRRMGCGGKRGEEKEGNGGKPIL